MECHKGFVAAAQLLSSTSLGRAHEIPCFFFGWNQTWFSKLYGPFAGFPSRYFSCIFMEPTHRTPQRDWDSLPGMSWTFHAHGIIYFFMVDWWESVRIGSSWWDFQRVQVATFCIKKPPAIGAIGRLVGCRYHWNCGDMTFRSIWT